MAIPFGNPIKNLRGNCIMLWVWRIWRDSVWRKCLWSLVRCSPNSSGIIEKNSELKEVAKSIE